MEKLEDVGIPFGKYRIYRKFAVGGMAELYLAKQPGIGGFNRTIVLKCILPHLSQEQSFVTMFLDEARVASHINHPNVVHILDIGQTDGIHFIAMEYIRGQNLKQVGKKLYQQKQQPFPFAMIAALGVQAARGLSAAHTATDENGSPLHIVHRDVSPNNLLLSYNGVLKVVDFGVAKATIQEHQTNAGMVKGKYRYMSPEQLSGLPVDPRTDTFALGIVLYELTTNVGLFKRATEVETIQAVHFAPIHAPSRLEADYPPELEQIVMKALERDPARRFATAEEMAQALEGFLYRSQNHIQETHLATMMQGLFAEEIEKERAESTGSKLSRQDLFRFSGSHATGQETSFDSQPSYPSSASASMRAYPSRLASVQGQVHPPEAHPSPPPPRSRLPLLLALMFLTFAVGLASVLVVASLRRPSLDISKEKQRVQDLLEAKQYVAAEARIQRLRTLPIADEESPWLAEIEQRLLLAPKLDLLRQFLQEKRLPEARSLLSPLLRQFPQSPELLRIKIDLDLPLVRPLPLSDAGESPEEASEPVAREPEGRPVRRRRAGRRRVSARVEPSPRPPPPLRPDAPAPGKLYISSTPSGGRVTLNGSLIGFTPINGQSLPPGRYQLQISRDGFVPYNKLISVSSGGSTEIQEALQPFVSKRRVEPPAPSESRTPPSSSDPTPALAFSSSSLGRSSNLRLLISDPRGIVGLIYTEQHHDLAKKIEADVARLLGSRFSVQGITRPWQTFVKQRAQRDSTERSTFYPRAVAFTIYEQIARGRSKDRVAQLLVSYERSDRFRSLKTP